MARVHIIATFFPVPGRVERMRELLTAQCLAVYEKEPYALRFILTEQRDSKTPQFCLFETYSSAEATAQHLSEPHFKGLIKALQEESLMAQPPIVLQTESVAGFDLDRVWIVSLQ